MIGKADAVVIGAGIMGASTAHFLTRLGFGQVALVEKRRICGGSTQYSAAHVRQHYSNEVGIRLAVRGAAMFSERRRGPRRARRFRPDRLPALRAARGRAGAARDRPVQQSFGVETSLLEPAEVEQPLAELRLEGVALACHEPTSGFANPVHTVESLVALGAAGRASRLRGCEVLAISTADGRVTGVVTGEGEIATRVVVNACGPWGDRIGRMAGVDYPITFSREHEAIFDAPEGFEDFPVISDVPQRLYCRPYLGRQDPRRRRLAEGEGARRSRDLRRRHRRRARRARWCRGSSTACPRSRPTLTQPNYGGAFVTGYSGVYDITEDWYPIVGEEELGGYYSCFGGSGHGFKIGPAIGEALADAIAGQEPRDRHLEPLGLAVLGRPHLRLGLGAGEPRMTSTRSRSR